MVVIKVRIQSNHTGAIGGFAQFSIDDITPVKELIKLFCEAKNVPIHPTYAIANHSNMILDQSKPISHYNVSNNELLYFASTTDEGRTYNFGNWFKIAGLAHFIGLVGLVVCIVVFLKARDVPDSYSIVLDAGSTHTDIVSYSWPGSKINCTGKVTQLNSCTIDGGIALVNPENVTNYLDTCFGKAVKTIPSKFQSQSQIFFGATAGLRVLNETRPKEVAKIMEEVKKYFKKSGLGYREENVQIITGSVEGLSGWITGNYLKETLLPNVTQNQTNPKKIQSWGSLDLGGASTQISFEVNEGALNKINNSLVVSVELFGYKHNVYSQSFLCYGVVQAMNRYRAKLTLEAAKGENNIDSPCEPKGYNITIASDQIFGTLCFPYKFSGAQHSYTFKGSGDYEKCKNHTTTILSVKFCLLYDIKDNCIDVSGLSDNFADQNFIAHSAFGYIVEDLDLPVNCSQPNYVKKVKRYCSKSLEDLEGRTRSRSMEGIPIRVWETLCFNAVYSYTLLTDVYNFTQNEWSNILFQNEINGSSLGWSLGYMVNATENISSGDPIPQLNVTAFSCLMVLFSAFVLISIGIVVHAIRIRKSATYERFQNNS